MPPTPLKKGREVLSQLPNGAQASHPRSPLKPVTVLEQPASISKHAATPPPRPSLLAAGKRARLSPHLKRVSFGGDTINIIKQHVSEFSTPPSEEPESRTPSPVSKKQRSLTSPPPPGGSPMFARANSDLEDEDDTVTMPDANKLTKAAVSPMRRQSTRESFGMFLDTDIGHEMGENEGDYTLSLAERHVLEVDSPTGSDGDVTQNIMGIVEHAEEDEAMGAEDQPGPSILSQNNGAVEKRRRSSIRQSLPYLANVDVNEEEESNVNRPRWSMVPINEENADFGAERDEPNDESPSDATFHVRDLLSHLDDEGTEPMVSASNTSSVPVREKLPDNRQLFDSTEEPTIHFHDEIEQQQSNRTDVEQRFSSNVQPADENRSVEEPIARRETPVKSILKQSTTRPASIGVGAPLQITSSAAITTPLSVSRHDTTGSITGSIIRSVRDRTPANRQRQVESQLRELSDSVLKKSRPPPTPSTTNQKRFGVKEFLAAAKLRFDDGIAVDTRKPSLAPAQHNVVDADTRSAEWGILESVKKRTILRRLQGEVEKYLEQTKEAAENIERAEEEMEKVRPAVFVKLGRIETLSVGEVTNLQCSLKRLQKVVMREVRLDWVKKRQIWEGEMGNELDDVVKMLEGDMGSVREAVERYEGVCRELGDVVENVEEESGDVEKIREEVMREWDEVEQLGRKVNREGREIKEFTEEKGSLTSRKETLEIEHGRLETFGGDKADDKMKKVLTERRELNAIVGKVSGVRPYLMTAKKIGVQLSEMVDVTLDIEEGVVKNVQVKALREGTELIAEHLKEIRRVDQVALMFSSCASHLAHIGTTLQQAERYFDRHLGQVESVQVQQSPTRCLEIKLHVPLYSLRLHCKLDVNMTLAIVAPHATQSQLCYKLSDLRIDHYINTVPTEQTVRESLVSNGFSTSNTIFNLHSALASLWRLLE